MLVNTIIDRIRYAVIYKKVKVAPVEGKLRGRFRWFRQVQCKFTDTPIRSSNLINV